MKDISHSLFWIFVLHTRNEGHFVIPFLDLCPSYPESSGIRQSISRWIEKLQKQVGKNIIFPYLL